MDDSYRQIVSGKEVEIKIKGSRFIGEVELVENVEAADAFLANVKKREYSATHHCWAYKIGADGTLFRFNDDGEPSGTAGQPILRQIHGAGITNVIVVVTRYYGGTKLGTGGLIRAYGDAAKEVLAECVFEEIVVRQPVRVVFDYNDTSAAMHTIKKYDIVVRSSSYNERTTLVLDVRESELEAFKAAFIDTLRGRGLVEVDL